MPLSTPIVGDIVGRIDEKGQLDVKSCVTVEPRTLSRISRNCDIGRLTPTGPLPGSDISTSSGEPGQHEQDILNEEGLDNVTWQIEEIPRLSTKGTRRGLVSQFTEFTVDTVARADGSTMGKRWEQGPTEDTRWHPEGACVRFRFTLSSGSYATVLLREFMQAPVSQM